MRRHERPGLTLRELARALGCSIGAVHADLASIRTEWVERRRAPAEPVAAEDLICIDAAIATICPQVLAGKS